MKTNVYIIRNIFVVIAIIVLKSPVLVLGSSTSNMRTTGQTFQVTEEPPVRIITGTVKDEKGQPVKDVLILSTMPAMDEKIVTDSEGKFSLRFPIMQGMVSTSRGPMQMSTYIIARQKEKNLAAVINYDDQTNNYEIQLSQATILSGKIIDPNGMGIQKAETFLGYRMTDREIMVFPESTKIDANGIFEMRAVPQGFKYLVYASAKGYGERYIEIDLRPDPNERVDLQSIVLELANLSISGVVVDQQDQPISGARISVSGNGQPRIPAPGNTPYEIQEIRTNTKGEFKIEGICPGELILEIKDGPSSVSRARVKGGDKDIKLIVPSSFGMPAQVQRPSSN